jgi:phosphoribosylanthranilate isomerase
MIVKICGITTLDDARFAIDAGADWIGLNLVSGPRRIELPAALTILNGLRDPAHVVGLVTVQNGILEDSIAAALWDHDVHRLQLYGQVTPQAIDSLQKAGFETIFVQPVADEHSLEVLDAFLAVCGDAHPDYLLFDAAVEGQYGGTGQRANWEAMARVRACGRYAHWPPVILAGGLTPDNVAEAIRFVAPVGVDVSSGVESARRRKDPEKVRRFIAAARAARPE